MLTSEDRAYCTAPASRGARLCLTQASAMTAAGVIYRLVQYTRTGSITSVRSYVEYGMNYAYRLGFLSHVIYCRRPALKQREHELAHETQTQPMGSGASKSTSAVGTPATSSGDPSSRGSAGVACLIIDPQNSFHAGGSLAVSGADEVRPMQTQCHAMATLPSHDPVINPA